MPRKSHRHHTEKEHHYDDHRRPRHVQVDSNPREYFITTTVEEYAPLSLSSSESCQRKWSANEQLNSIRHQGFCSMSRAPKDEFALLKDHLVDRNCVRASYGYANDDGRAEQPMLDEVELLKRGYVDTVGRRQVAEYPVLQEIPVNTPISTTSCTTVESSRHGRGRQRLANDDHVVPKQHRWSPSNGSKHYRHKSQCHRHPSGYYRHHHSRHCRHDNSNDEDGRSHRHSHCHGHDRGHKEGPTVKVINKKRLKDVMVEPEHSASPRQHCCSHHRRRHRDERNATRELGRKADLPHIHFNADAETTTAKDMLTSLNSKTSTLTSATDPIKIGSMVFEIDSKTNKKGESALLSYAIEENCRQYTLVSLIGDVAKPASETLRVQTLELKFSNELSLLRINRLNVCGGK